MLTAIQRKTAQAIVNIFETSKVRGDYGKVTVLDGDSGHLTYGRSQTTLSSGNLYLLIKAYCDTDGTEYGQKLKPYLDRLESEDVTLDKDKTLKKLLEDAGRDSVMRQVQDDFFDRAYWQPAAKASEKLGIESALGRAVVYDSRVHGSWPRIRDLTVARHGDVASLGEQPWIAHYVAERRNWLVTHSNELLHKTAYRMDAFNKIINEGNWTLTLPMRVRGTKIDADLLTAAPIQIASAEESNSRLLRIANPLLAGDDVTDVQRALVREGIDVEITGKYDDATAEAVTAFQTKEGLTADGKVGAITRGILLREDEPGPADAALLARPAAPEPAAPQTRTASAQPGWPAGGEPQPGWPGWGSGGGSGQPGHPGWPPPGGGSGQPGWGSGGGSGQPGHPGWPPSGGGSGQPGWD